MKILFFGGSSDIAVRLAKKIKNVENISRSKSKIYKENYLLKSYTQKNIRNVIKKINKKYDNILIFNGKFSSSFLTNYIEKDFEKIFSQNFKTPLLIAQQSLENKILNKGASIFFISSIAAETDEPGNAYYSIAKNSLNFAAKILGNEQKKRGLRVNVISLGVVNNQMGKKAINTNLTGVKKNIYKNDSYLKEIIKIIKNKKINLKKIIIR
tara:strand:- start:1688 stop:2320 length:633 start_codon:yes stop_codon:yes gene_type:complete